MTGDVDLDLIVRDILARPRSGAGPRLVGVDGPSGSGKSSFAKALAGRLPAATLLWLDDFVSWGDFAGWWPRFDTELLTPLLAGPAVTQRADGVRYQVRDWEGDEFGAALGPWKFAPFAPIIVMDGVTCTRRAVASRLTYAVWVEAPYDVRLARGIARDGESHRQLWLDWMVIEDAFFAADGARARADLRIATA